MVLAMQPDLFIVCLIRVQLPDLMSLADGASSETSLECSELKQSYFPQLLNVWTSTTADVKLVQPVESCQISVEPSSLQEVSDAINLLKDNKAAGVCEISAEMINLHIKYGGDVVEEAVFQLIDFTYLGAGEASHSMGKFLPCTSVQEWGQSCAGQLQRHQLV